MEIHLGERMAKEDLGLRHIWREEVTQENLGWRYVVGKRWLVRTWDGGTLGRTWHWRVWDGDTCQRGNTQRSRVSDPLACTQLVLGPSCHLCLENVLFPDSFKDSELQ
jgi:hypothetical protein